MNGLPPRMTRPEIATVWKLTPQRVGVILKKHGLKPDADNMFETDEVMRIREAQISKEEARVFFKGYHKHPTPKVLDHLIADEDEVDPLDCTPSAATPSNKNAILVEAASKHAQLTELRAREIEQRLVRQERKYMREDGLLIDRADVQRTGIEIGTEIINMLRTLEVELVEIFSDEDTRQDVREKVETVVARCQASIYRRLTDLLGAGEVGGDE